MSVNIIAQNSIRSQVAPYKSKTFNVSEVLALADEVLEKHNRAWAEYVISGDAGAFKLALALKRDRADLLAEVGHDGL